MLIPRNLNTRAVAEWWLNDGIEKVNPAIYLYDDGSAEVESQLSPHDEPNVVFVADLQFSGHLLETAETPGDVDYLIREVILEID